MRRIASVERSDKARANRRFRRTAKAELHARGEAELAPKLYTAWDVI